jgi:phosphate transport system substrate-binding protein
MILRRTIALVISTALAAVALCTPAAQGADSPIFSAKDYPRVDGSTATQPLGLAFQENFTGEDLLSSDVVFNKTDEAYKNLIAGKADLILVTSPSSDELAAAKAARVELEVTPVVNEGFVFITNEGNAVTDLTLQQLQDIYAGKITDWSQVGGPAGQIRAYQRPENSGSQTGMLELVMKGIPMMVPPQDWVFASMMPLVEQVASHFNEAAGALGYSYYYYVTAMYGKLASGDAQGGVQLVSVNGVKPTDAAIADKSYPLTTSYYIVINKAAAADSPARKLKEAMLSERGQRVAKDAGYVPLGGDLEPDPTPTPKPKDPNALETAKDLFKVNPITVTYSDFISERYDDWVCQQCIASISGLADNTVQDSINHRLNQMMTADHPGLITRANSTSASQVDFNAGNVLAVTWMEGVGQGLVTPWAVSQVAVRLDTGAAVRFSDIFATDANVPALIADAVYHSLSTFGGVPADIEGRVLDALDAYARDPNPDFILRSDAVQVTLAGIKLTIDFASHPKSIAIYQVFAGGDWYTGPASECTSPDPWTAGHAELHDGQCRAPRWDFSVTTVNAVDHTACTHTDGKVTFELVGTKADGTPYAGKQATVWIGGEDDGWWVDDVHKLQLTTDAEGRASTTFSSASSAEYRATLSVDKDDVQMLDFGITAITHPPVTPLVGLTVSPTGTIPVGSAYQVKANFNVCGKPAAKAKFTASIDGTTNTTSGFAVGDELASVTPASGTLDANGEALLTVTAKKLGRYNLTVQVDGTAPYEANYVGRGDTVLTFTKGMGDDDPTPTPTPTPTATATTTTTPAPVVKTGGEVLPNRGWLVGLLGLALGAAVLARRRVG